MMDEDFGDLRPIFSTGLRLVIGSWKIMPMRLPRMRLHRVEWQVEQVPALEVDRPVTRELPGDRSRMIDMAVTLLPEPDSPTTATVSFAPMSKLTSLHDIQPFAADAEGCGEIGNRKDRDGSCLSLPAGD
jgi:hypothetical protein